MPSWFCKIWKFVLGFISKVVDFVLSVVKKLIGFVVEAIESIADSIFGSGSLLLFAAVGLGLYLLLKKDDSNQGSAYTLNDRQGGFS